MTWDQTENDPCFSWFTPNIHRVLKIGFVFSSIRMTYPKFWIEGIHELVTLLLVGFVLFFMYVFVYMFQIFLVTCLGFQSSTQPYCSGDLVVISGVEFCYLTVCLWFWLGKNKPALVSQKTSFQVLKKIIIRISHGMRNQLW